MVRRLVGAAGIIALAAIAVIGWLSPGIGVLQATAQTAGPVVPVTAGTVATEDVPVFLHGIGTAQAYNMVSIKSRVDGQIVKIDFKEGQEVKEGDPLLLIDPRPYQAALAQAEATKQKDEAQRPISKDTRNLFRPGTRPGRATTSRRRWSRSCRPRSGRTRRRSKPPNSTLAIPTSARRSTDGWVLGSLTRAIRCAQPTTPCSLRSPR